MGTVVSRVLDDKKIPNSILTGGLLAVTKDQNIPDTVLDELGGSVALRAEQMYLYGKQQYTHGLPSGQFYSAFQGRAEVEAVLSTLHGSPVHVEYSHYQPPNMQHTGWMKLIRDHGYDPATNLLGTLSTVKGWEVYLEDMTLVIPDSLLAKYSLAALEQWGSPATAGYAYSREETTALNVLLQHTPITADTSAVTPFIKVDYSWMVDGVSGFYRGSFTMSVEEFTDTADHFQAKYLIGGETKYWLYKGGAGTYPTLDNLYSKPAVVNGQFFPFGYFRYNKTSEISNKNTASYKTGKKLVKYLGMSFDAVSEAIDKNPNIADVEQAMLIMAVPANSTNPMELRYLFKFFDALFASNGKQYSTPEALSIAQRFGNGSDFSRGALVIQDTRFKMALSNDGVTKRHKVGSIGKIGTHSFLLVSRYGVVNYTDGNGNTGQETITIKTHTYRKQVSNTIYEEIQVASLQMLYFVYGQYITGGEGNSTILMVPIDRSITQTYSLPDKEALYSRAMHYVFNSRVVTEVKWYQSDFFQLFILFVAVVMAFVTMGASLLALSTAVVTGVGLSAAVYTVVTKLLIGLVMGQLFKIAAKAIGIEAALVIAVIAAIAGGYMEFADVNIAGAPWANQLLNLATGLAKASSEVLADMFKDLAQQFSDFAGLSDAAGKELATANKLLENNNYLSPIVIFGEQPNDFYNRTIHSGNVGINAIGAISLYVDTALTLPKLAETLGESPYGIND